MTHKLVGRLVFLVTLCVLIAAIGFALVVSYTPRLSGVTPAPDEPIRALARKVLPVPHPVDSPRFVNCETCHALAARFPVPANHHAFGNQTCGLCHAFPLVAEAPVETEPHAFGWRSPLGQSAMEDFGVPDPCALTTPLEKILTGTTCSVRPDGQTCLACHWAGRADAGVRLDDLKDKQDLIDRGYVERFVSEQSAKPPNLKGLFADWRSRGYPD
ncbi:MAG: hypothetical protein WAK53_02980 [Chromatiaceae bacterium]|jgi:hypothetical protein